MEMKFQDRLTRISNVEKQQSENIVTMTYKKAMKNSAIAPMIRDRNEKKIKRKDNGEETE